MRSVMGTTLRTAVRLAVRRTLYDDLRTRKYHSHNRRTCLAV